LTFGEPTAAGRIVARYPSRSTPGERHTIIVVLDGYVVSCSCTASRFGKTCLHRASGDAIVREYHRRRLMALPGARLVARESWFAARPVGEMDAARQLERAALAEVMAARYVAAHGLYAAERWARRERAQRAAVLAAVLALRPGAESAA